MDVGSGPVSILSRLNTIYTNLVISAADPLAEEYSTLYPVNLRPQVTENLYQTQKLISLLEINIH